METQRHGLDVFGRGSHPISAASNGFNINSDFAQFVPQAAHMRVQCSRSRLAVVTPDLIHQDLAREDVSAAAHEFVHQIEFLCGQLYLKVPDKTLAALGVQLDTSEPDQIATLFRHPPENRFHTKHQFSRTEGLRYIIIGSNLEANDPINFFAPRSQHDYRDSS